MVDVLDIVKQEVEKLLGGEKSGHDSAHSFRVYQMAVKFARAEGADEEIVALAALLHDVDDYKLFGQEGADGLLNARKIMARAEVPSAKQAQVCEIINSMGYSKSLVGIRPKTIEGKVVSDADMLEGMGATVIVRCLAFFANERGVFDRNVWPNLDISAGEYKKIDRKSNNFINHFFEKLLRLKGMMLTGSGKAEAAGRHDFMVAFLRQFFVEQDADEWSRFLEDFLSSVEK